MDTNDFSTMDVTTPVFGGDGGNNNYGGNNYGGNNYGGDNYGGNFGGGSYGGGYQNNYDSYNGNNNYGGGYDGYDNGDNKTKVLGAPDDDVFKDNREFNQRGGADYDDDLGGATMIVLPPSVKMDPAVGWLVCIEGVDKGRSFRLVKGNNTIGRKSAKKDYAVNLSDQGISRSGAVAVIVYNEKSNRFFITPGDLTNNINPYLNEEILLSPQLIEPRAKIEIANDQLIFVPFCSDKFVWKFEAEEKPAEAQPKGSIVQCPHGHYYDSSKERECPVCKRMQNDPDGMTIIL